MGSNILAIKKYTHLKMALSGHRNFSIIYKTYCLRRVGVHVLFSSFQITKLNNNGPIKVCFLSIQLTPISSLYNVLNDWCSVLMPYPLSSRAQACRRVQHERLTRLPTSTRLDFCCCQKNNKERSSFSKVSNSGKVVLHTVQLVAVSSSWNELN